MNATQGTILIMIGALALWLTWSAKSPFATATQAQIDAARKQGAADAQKIIDSKSGPFDTRDPNAKPPGTYNVPGSLKTLLECTSKGGTWDYVNNECVVKQ